MTSRSAVPVLHRFFAVCIVVTMAGCASRSLNPPSVVDWSEGAPASGATPTVPQVFYTVKRDDTLLSIAKKFDTTPADLATWNNFGPNPRIRIDQVLKVSPPAPPAAVPQEAPVAIPQPIGNESVEQRPLGSPAPVAPAPPAPSSNAPLKSGPLGLKRPYSDAAFAEMSKPDGDAGAAAPAPSAAPAAPTAAPSSLSWSWPSGARAASTFDVKTKGLDFPGKAGDPVLAAADGKVTFAGTGVRGYGNFVIIRHTPELLSVYANNKANLVKEGAMVTKGQKIAEMGGTDSDAVKLHFEIRNDSKPVDPLKYLPER